MAGEGGVKLKTRLRQGALVAFLLALLWAAGLALISVPRVFPMVVRVFGLVAALLFAATACCIFAGAQITALSQPLPFFAYPVLVATFVGWIVTILRDNDAVTRPSV